MFPDYLTILAWAENLRNGSYFAYYPIPFIYFFQIFTFLPKDIGALVFLGLTIVLLVDVLKRDIFRWLLFTPLLVHLEYGQVSVIFWWLYKRSTPWSLALMTMKPQLFVLALPRLLQWVKNDRFKVVQFVFYLVMLWVPFFIIRPNWVQEWIAGLGFNDRVGDMQNSISFFLHPEMLITYIIFLLVFSRYVSQKDLWSFALVPINLAMRFYDLVFLMGKKTSNSIILVAGVIAWISLLNPNKEIIWLASFIPILLILEKLCERQINRTWVLLHEGLNFGKIFQKGGAHGQTNSVVRIYRKVQPGRLWYPEIG